jgi:hypothetical protein
LRYLISSSQEASMPAALPRHQQRIPRGWRATEAERRAVCELAKRLGCTQTDALHAAVAALLDRLSGGEE